MSANRDGASQVRSPLTEKMLGRIAAADVCERAIPLELDLVAAVVVRQHLQRPVGRLRDGRAPPLRQVRRPAGQSAATGAPVSHHPAQLLHTDRVQRAAARNRLPA